MSVSVAAVHIANTERVYMAVRWDCSIYAVMCHTWLWICAPPPRAPPLGALQICVVHARTWGWQADISGGLVLDDSTTTSYDALHFVRGDWRRLPQRHLLTLYANETQRGVMRKEWQIRTEEKQKERHVKPREKNYIWAKCLNGCANKRERKKNIAHPPGYTVWEKWKTNAVGRLWKRSNGGTNEGHQQPYWGYPG